MITDHDIARWRLRTQQAVAPFASTVLDVVGGLLAVQAENPQQSAWAVASRTREPRQRRVAEVLEDGRLIRTHVLRPTWHYVRAEDAGWLLDLTAQRVRPTITQQLHGALGMDSRSIERATSVVVEALEVQRQLTRGELAQELRQSGFETAASG